MRIGDRTLHTLVLAGMFTRIIATTI